MYSPVTPWSKIPPEIPLCTITRTGIFCLKANVALSDFHGAGKTV
jgi:hypothetical protein